MIKKWRITSPFLILIFILLPIHAKATQQNILSPYVKSQDIIQDNNGYIWFAGQSGLSRFDGVNIVNFSAHSSHRKLPFSWVHDITPIGNDFIVSTESHNLWRFNPQTGASSKINTKLPDRAIYDMIEFKGDYYLNIPFEIYSYSPLTTKSSLLIDNINISFFEKTTENLYAAGLDGLYVFKNETFSLIVKDNVHKILTTKNGVLAITSKFIQYIGDNGEKIKKPNNKNYIMGTTTNDGHFILINKQGNIVKLLASTLTEIKHNYPSPTPLIAKMIMQDTSDTLWIVSNKGIKKISPSTIINHPKIYNVSTNANEIELFDNNIIIGTYGDGIHVFNNNLSLLPSKINPYLTDFAKKTMDLLAIDDDLYIASFDGLWVYNRLDKQVKRVNFTGNNKLLLKLTKKQNLLYIATNYNGFYIYNLLTNKIIEHVDVDKGISSSEVIDIMTLDNHKVWLATSKGIDIYNRYTKVIQHINLPGQTKVISFSVFKNKIYVSTKGDGIFILNFHGDILSRIGVGINFSMIGAINNEIWAPAQQGLYRINTENNTIPLVPNTEQYTFTDRPVMYKNNAYIPHYNGMLEVPLTQTEKYNPKILISETNISGKTSLANNNVQVNSKNDIVSFNLASLDFRSGTPKKFQYTINNGDWNNIYGNQLTLTGLQSGNYKLAIKGTNSLGQWSDKQAFAEINVAYPWYLTPKMKILYISLSFFTVIAISLLLYFRFKSIRKIHSLLSNDIKLHGKVTFNIERNLIRVKELLSSNSEKLTAAQLHQISQIVNESIDLLSQDDNDIEPNSIRGKSLEVALPYFVSYVYQKYHSSIKLQLDIPESRLSHEMQADIYKIIYETIISTIINGSGSNFEIILQEFKQKMWLTISNDQNGFSKFKNKINFDMSMYYIRQIAGKYNASLNVFDKENSGSQLIISIPLMDIS